MIPHLQKKIVPILNKIKKIPLLHVKLIISFITINIILFIYMANINYLQLINPLQFLSKAAIDNRKEYTLYLPSRNNLTELLPVKKKIFFTDDTQGLEINILNFLYELHRSTQSFLVDMPITNLKIYKKIWLLNKKLIIHLNKKEWDLEEELHQKILKQSIEKSILKNFSTINTIDWVL